MMPVSPGTDRCDMRVNPTLSNASVDTVRTPADPRPAAKGTSATPSDVDSLGRSSELSRLLDALHQLPDVREDVIAKLQIKVAAGALDHESALAEAAAGIVDGATG